ncbi:MAG TPA: hypothetical protein VJM12_20445 [Pyrinomonadaceae bacterium]|nr:hypothetical protein [Pyrinomonadaceae bacterium]
MSRWRRHLRLAAVTQIAPTVGALRPQAVTDHAVVAAPFISYTCYRETGVCNANGAVVVFSACYRGSCCCPSGNCAGQGGGGGGSGSGGEGFCWSDWDCFAGEYCDSGTGTCYEYGSGPGGIMPE